MNYSGKTKYCIIMEELKEQIRSGIMQPGDKIPSEYELIEHYKMSRHTVRKALSILEDEDIITAVQGKGRYCKQTSLSHVSTKIIAVVITYMSNYIYPKIINGIDEVLSKEGYSIILKNTKNSRMLEIECLEQLLKQNVDGIIIEASKSQIYSRHLEIFKRFEEANIPTVFLHSTYPQFQNKPLVALNDELGMYQLTKYILNLGHKELVGIFKTDDTQGIRRHAGFVKALNDYGVPYNPDKIIWYHTEDKKLKPVAEIERMIQEGERIDSIICYNDQIACYMLELLNRYKLKVPDDLSITGFDYTMEDFNSSLTITTMKHPKEELGMVAAQLLLDLVEQPDLSHDKLQIKLEPEFVEGNTCGPK